MFCKSHRKKEKYLKFTCDYEKGLGQLQRNISSLLKFFLIPVIIFSSWNIKNSYAVSLSSLAENGPSNTDAKSFLTKRKIDKTTLVSDTTTTKSSSKTATSNRDDKSKIGDNSDSKKNDKNNSETEPDIFSLDESEFEITDAKIEDQTDKVEVKFPKSLPKTESKKTEIKNEVEIDSKEDFQEEKKEEIEKVKPVAKQELITIKPRPASYDSLINPPEISQRNYNVDNIHLDPVIFKEEYYQMLFAAIDQANLPAISELTNRIGFYLDLSVNGQTPLIYAINKGDINIIRKMLALGYNPNKKDDFGNAPIHLAIVYDRIDILTELINYDADLQIPSPEKKTPLEIAFEFGNEEALLMIAKALAIKGGN